MADFKGIIDRNSIGTSEALRELVTEGYGCRITSDGEIVEWICDIEQPTNEAIQEKIIELQAEYDAQEYARNREAEYPSIQDVTVALAEKEEGDSTMWDEITAKRAAVKAKYTKP